MVSKENGEGGRLSGKSVRTERTFYQPTMTGAYLEAGLSVMRSTIHTPKDSS